MTRILVTGASGFLGYTLCRDLAQAHEVVAGFNTHPVVIEGCQTVRLDIADPAQVGETLQKCRPEIVVHSAALAHPDVCEQNPRAAREIIVQGTQNIAQHSVRQGCRLFQISTDLVFDGERGNYTEEDPVRGISVYSRCKIAAEQVVFNADVSAVVLRVAVLYGPASPFSRGFPGNTLAAWRAGRAMTFYTDQFRTPTFTPQVSRVVAAMSSRPDLRGVFHVGGAERVSRYEFARLVAARAGVPPELVVPGSMHTAGAQAARGPDCSLVSEKLRSALGLAPLWYADGLEIMAREGLLAP